MPAAADDLPFGDDEVSISVTIEPLGPCVAGTPGCAGGGDSGLANTGGAIASIGVALALAGIGLGAYAVTRRRKDSTIVRS